MTSTTTPSKSVRHRRPGVVSDGADKKVLRYRNTEFNRFPAAGGSGGHHPSGQNLHPLPANPPEVGKKKALSWLWRLLGRVTCFGSSACL